ncbi:MAG: hypothetical protein CVT71_00790 [Alphaproteobacteria bacterium HGW-Alphaproteobacteria-10]|jgi:hypothetical protein|nr:MAG: hypothetical protein CVT71_00790 [Alphaproteobacteria bacterium HGW-Alphaproteobacteria-10]
MLWSLTYISRAMVNRHSVEILDIARDSMRNNAVLGLTGALYFDDMQFCQVIEGERSTLMAMFERIRRDHRHRDVVVVHEGPVTAPRFPEWSMKFIDGGWVPSSRKNFAYDALRIAPPETLHARVQELRTY